jgi:hypothetical protein
MDLDIVGLRVLVIAGAAGTGLEIARVPARGRASMSAKSMAQPSTRLR